MIQTKFTRIPISGRGHMVKSHIHNFHVDVYMVISSGETKMVGHQAVKKKNGLATTFLGRSRTIVARF